MPLSPMRWLMNQATGTSMPIRHRIEMAVGTSTEPLARMIPEMAEAMPKITRLHSMMCSSVCAISITGALVMKKPMRWRENR